LKFFTFNASKLYLINHTKKPKNKKVVDCYYIRDLSYVVDFSGFIFKKGLSLRYKTFIYKIFSKINTFLYFNRDFVYFNYPQIHWILDEIFEKKLNSQCIFKDLVNLLKPPFVVKTVLVSKKLKKKLKKKYSIRIVYKNDEKRIKNSIKQIHYFSNQFEDHSFDVRLYKAIIFSFLDWKQSQLFKFKSRVFIKFFKL